MNRQAVGSSVARHRLESIVGDLETFKRETWGHRPAVFAGDSPAVGLTVAAIDEMFACGLVRPPFATIIASTGRPGPAEYTSTLSLEGRDIQSIADHRMIAEWLSKGASLLLEHLELWCQEVAQFVEGWDELLSAKLRVAGFLTPPQTQTLRIHRDLEDTLIVQLAGDKQWTVYDNFELRGGPTDHPGEPLLKVELTPGDVLHVPAGYPHQVFTTDQASLHLTVGFARVAPDELARLLGQLMIDSTPELLRGFGTMTAGQTLSALGDGLARIDSEMLGQRLSDLTGHPLSERFACRAISDVLAPSTANRAVDERGPN